MKCHYEVLGVDQKATDEELKRTYRRCALQWHPDKNPDNLEEAKVKFQLIQAAYEVLSDPQERAFYDRNRESILRGKASGGDGKSETLDLFSYFTTSCYKGFNDSEKGFYTVYRNVFEKIVAQDMEYIDDEEEISIPNFGNSRTELEDVAEFYGYWTSYCSFMSFTWEDTYDIRQAPNRWVEKKIEKENKKAREKAKKEYNEEIRSLVAFVKKRDKRWQARKKQIEEKILENARKQEAEQNRSREERMKLLEEQMEKEKANMAQYEDQLKEMEAQFASEWGFTDEEESDAEDSSEKAGQNGSDNEDFEYLQQLMCAVCDKMFKTEKAKENHEKSKKHKENLDKLIKEDELFLEEDLVPNTDETISDQEVEVQTKSSKKKKKKKRNKNKVVVLESDDSDANESNINSETDNTIGNEVDNTIDNKVDNTIDNKVDNTTDDIVDNTTDNTVGDTVDNTMGDKMQEDEEIETINKDQSTDHDRPPSKTDKPDVPKLKGKKAKDARKAAKQAAEETSAAQSNEPKESICNTCGHEFPSRSKLFNHIKSTGHAEFKTVNTSKVGQKKKHRK